MGLLRTGMAAGIVLFAAVTAAAAQHGKIDRVEFWNGDSITCEVLSLVRAVLTVKTDGLGTLSIQWDKVRGITSPVVYEVEYSSGYQEFGALSSPMAGQIKVGGLAPLPLSDVVRIVPIERGFWRKLEGSFSLGYGFTQASNRTQWTVDAALGARTPKYAAHTSYDALIADEDNGDPENRQTLTADLQREMKDRWFAAAIGQFSHNLELGLDYRSVTGGAVGRLLSQSNTNLFTAFAGVAYTRELYVDLDPENHAEVLTGARLDWFTTIKLDTDLVLSGITYVDLRADSRFRVELKATFRHEIVTDLTWALNFSESFNSSPPAGEKKNDLTLSASIGWSFR